MAMSNAALLAEVSRFAAQLTRFQRALEQAVQTEEAPALMTAEQWSTYQAEQEREAGTRAEETDTSKQKLQEEKTRLSGSAKAGTSGGATP